MLSSQKKNLFLLTGLFLLLGLISLSCNLPAGIQEKIFGYADSPTETPLPTNTPQPLPPAIVESDPPAGSTVSLEGSITLYFNQSMNKESVTSNLSTDPAIDWSLEWVDPSALRFTPDQPLPPGSEIQLLLDDGAAAENGLFLPEEQVLFFYTADYLSPVTFLPSPGSIEIDPLSSILVTFNQPVTSLGDGNVSDPQALIIDPLPSGKGEWINTSTYQYSPDPGLAGGTTYQVEILPDLRSTAGTTLEGNSPLSWSFSTSYPQVLDWEPHDGDSGVLLDVGIHLTFNQAMDPESVSGNFSLMDSEGEPVAGTFEWSDDYRVLKFVPDQLLRRGTYYAAVLPAEVISAGGTPLGLDTRFSFKTTGDFQFLGTPGGQSYSTSIYEGATLYFNNPVDLKTVEENITVIPEISNFWPSIGGNGNVLNIYGDYEPLTNYTLVMGPDLSDDWGSDLGIARSVKFTTEALSPNLTVTQGNNVLFLTGSENAIPVRGTNLYQISIDLGSIPTKDLPMFFGPGLYSNLEEYYPLDNQRWIEVLNVPGDDQYTINLPVNQTGTKLPPGLYRYQIYSQELPYNPAPYLLAVSNLHLTMKISPEDLLIWALDLRTGEQVSGAEITIYDHYGEEIFSGTTNQDGIYQAAFREPIDQYERVFYAVTGAPGEEDFGITASNWSFGTEAYNFGLASNYGSPQSQTYIYTDRPIYRPGQTVHYRLIHRDCLSGGYVLPEEESIDLTIYRSGEEEEIVSLPLSEFGTAAGEIQLSSYAEPGYYRLETAFGMTLFQVAEYRKPEIDLEVSLDQGESLIGEDWAGSVEARYYFDAPASEADLDWYLRAEPTNFTLPGYQTGELDNNWFAYAIYPGSWGTRITEGQGQTDQEGLWEIEGILDRVDIYDREVSLPANYVLSVTAQDETGFQVTSQEQMLVHPSEFYIGVQPSAWISEADEKIDFNILVVDWEREPDGIHQLRAEFSKVIWNYEIREIGQIDYTQEKELIADQDFSTNRAGEAEISFTPQEPGTYQLDIYGDGARTEVNLWVSGVGGATWPTQTNEKIKLVPDRDSYQPGDEATVFIPNPFPEGAQALITIERHKVVSYQTLLITGSGETIKIPLDVEDAPNIYLSVTLIGREDGDKLNFRQGYLNILVDPGEKLLQITVTGKPERLEPGEEVEFTIRITDQDGNPQIGEFSLAVVDKAVLALTDPFAPAIEEAFYGVQPLAVKMGFPLGMHAGRMVFVPGGMGGGGGDLEDSIRDEFEDTGYWRADVITNENGEAQVRFTLPDNLTTWQAEARGVTQETRVGQASTEVIATKDLLIRPVTPRFLVAGDHLALAAVVHNNTPEDLTVDVSLVGSGVFLDIPEDATQTVQVPGGGRTRVEWWGTAGEAEQADLLFTAESEGYSDAVKPYLGPLPIFRYLAPVSYGASGVLEEAGQELEIVSLPRTYDPTEGTLEIELAPSLASSILTALEALEDRELYSNESVMSYFLPNVVTYQTLKTLGLEYPQLESRLDLLIVDTLDNLAATQNDDGGWAWWEGGASDPEISSYILFGLTQAEEAGIFVDELMIQQATGYLMATLPAVDMLSESKQYNQQAMRYFALTEAGINVIAGMQDLAALESQLDPGYTALLAMALESGNPGNDWTRTLLSNLVGKGIRTATGLHWENQAGSQSWLSSTTTATAMAAYALARIEDSPTVLPETIRYLVSMKNWQGDWWSPYETSWTLLALNEANLKSGELTSGYDFSASVNGRELISGLGEGPANLEAAQASTPVEELFADEPNALVINRTEGSGSLYYKAHLQVYRPAEEAQPFGRGLSISRVYRRLTEDPIQFVQSGNVGDLIQVKLTLVVESEVHYLQIEDYFPAGAEILDTRLKTTRQDLDDYSVSAPFLEGWGWWYFTSPRIYDGRISWTAKSLPAGTYQLTYTLSLAHPGEFQVVPAHAQGIYFPEIVAVSAGDMFVIVPNH